MEREKKCNYCGIDPGLKPGSEVVWYGFRDAAMNVLVCWKCRDRHYEVKDEVQKELAQND